MFLAERSGMINIQTISPSMKKSDRLVIRLMLQIEEAGCIHSLSGGRIEQKHHVVHLITGPFGYHISYHDANANNSRGRIHQRLDPKGGGIFQTMPDRKVLGHEGFCWDAPAFSDITGVQAFPPADMVLTYKSALLSSLKPNKTHKVDHDVVLTLPQHAMGLLGPTSLLVQTDEAETNLRNWCERQARIWDSKGAIRLDVSVFTPLRPWLAIVAGSIS